MTATTTIPLERLYEQDETAWLEVMASIVAKGRFEDLDHVHLCEYLSDMARRDRREVMRRLIVLLTHLLKWQYQTDLRTPSCDLTILEQRRELLFDMESRTLRNHAESVLDKAYSYARERAAAETGIEINTFPVSLTFTLDEILADEMP